MRFAEKFSAVSMDRIGSGPLESSVSEGVSEGNYGAVGDCVLHTYVRPTRQNTQRI